MKWLELSWYKYLFNGCSGINNFICRIKGHPNGIVYYNVNAFEPDYHCIDCGEDLG